MTIVTASLAIFAIIIAALVIYAWFGTVVGSIIMAAIIIAGGSQYDQMQNYNETAANWLNNLDWYNVLLCIAIYIAIGFVVLAVTYVLDLFEAKRKYLKIREVALEQYKIKFGTSKNNSDHFKGYIRVNHNIDLDMKLKTGDIALSIFLWPWQLISTVWNHFTPLVVALYNRLFGNLLTRIKNLVFRDFNELNS